MSESKAGRGGGQPFAASLGQAFGSFLPGVIIGFMKRVALPLWLDKALVGVGEKAHVSRRIVCDNVIEEILGAGVTQLVRVTGWTNKSVSGRNRNSRLAGAQLARATPDQIKLPLCGVEMEREVRSSWWKLGKLDLEGVTAFCNALVEMSPEGLGDMAAKEMKATPRRATLDPRDFGFFGLLHKRASRTPNDQRPLAKARVAAG